MQQQREGFRQRKVEMMTIKSRRRKKLQRKRLFSGGKTIHPAHFTNLDEAVSSACTDLKSNSTEENTQGSCFVGETPSHYSVSRPFYTEIVQYHCNEDLTSLNTVMHYSDRTTERVVVTQQ